MRISAVILACCFAFALSTSPPQAWYQSDTYFQEGRNYDYMLQSQVLTGVKQISWQYTGFRLDAVVSLSIKRFDNVIMQLSNVQFLKSSDDLEVGRPTVILPTTLFDTYGFQEIVEVIEKELLKPLKFKWMNGVVSGIKIDETDEFWSVNLKKGVLNMLNVDINTKRSVAQNQIDHKKHESGIEGQCDSVYRYNILPFITTSNVNNARTGWTVTKTRDLSTCLDMPRLDWALFNTETCSKGCPNAAASANNAITMQSTTRVNMTVTDNGGRQRENFMSWNISTVSEYIFAPVHVDAGSVSSYVVQSLNFLEETPIRPKVTNSQASFVETSLKMDMAVSELRSKSNKEDPKMKDKIVTLLNNIQKILLTPTNDRVSEQDLQNDVEMPWYLTQLVKLMRRLSDRMIREIHDHCATEMHPRTLKLLLDILPSVGTKEAFSVLLHGSVLKPLPGFKDDWYVARSVRNFGMVNMVTDGETIIMLLDVLQNRNIIAKTNRVETRKALYLTLGSLTRTFIKNFNMIKNLRENQLDSSASLEVIETKVAHFLKTQLLLQKPDNLNVETRQIIILKAIGNSGLRKLLPSLLTMIKTKTLPVSVRVQAIWALQKMTGCQDETKVNTRIQETLIPIMFRVKEDVEIRLACYYIVMKTFPSAVITEDIVNTMMYSEPVQQVKDYILDDLERLASLWENDNTNTLTTQSCNCFKTFTANVSRVMRNKMVRPKGVQYSHAFQLPLQSRHASVSLESNVIFATDGFLPRTGNVKMVLGNSMGQQINPLEIGFRSKGLQDLLVKLLGPNGNMYGNKLPTLQDLFKTFKSDMLSGGDNDFGFYGKMFDKEIFYTNIDTALRDILNEGFVGVSNDWMSILKGEKKLSLNSERTFMSDGTIRVPTAFGFAFTVNVSSVTFTNLTGQINFVSSLFDKKSIHIETAITPKIISRHTIDGGMDGTIIQTKSAISTSLNVPTFKEELKFSVIYNKKENLRFRLLMSKPTTAFVNLLNFTVEHYHNMIYYRNDEIFAFQIPMFHKFNMGQSSAIEKEFSTNVPSLGSVIKTRLTYLQTGLRNTDDIHYILRSPIKLSVDLANENSDVKWMEMRVVSENRANFNGWVKKLQLLSVKEDNIVQPSGELDYEVEMTGELMQEVSYKFEAIVRNFFKNDHYKMTSVFQWPKTVKMDANSPLTLKLKTTNGQAPVTISTTITDSNSQPIVHYNMQFDMDHDTMAMAEDVSKNVEKYAQLCPEIAQCNADMKKNLGNSATCVSLFRAMNMLNRGNASIVVRQTAPKFLKSLFDYMIATRFWFSNNYFQGLQVMSESEAMPSSYSDVAKGDRSLYLQVLNSPINLHIGRLHYILSQVAIDMGRIQWPTFWITSLHPVEKLSTGLTKEVTSGKYPATCHYHLSNDDAYGQITTFDKLLYTTKRHDATKPTMTTSRRVLLTQDVENTIQVSVVTGADAGFSDKMLNILTNLQDLKTIRVLRELSGKVVKLYIDGNMVTATDNQPFVKVNKDGDEVLRVTLDYNTVIDTPFMTHISLPRSGIRIITDLSKVFDVIVSPFYHSRMRGLCGDFDGEHFQDMKSYDCKSFFTHPTIIEEPINEDPALSMESVVKSAKLNQWMKIDTCRPNKNLIARATMPTVQQ